VPPHIKINRREDVRRLIARGIAGSHLVLSCQSACLDQGFCCACAGELESLPTQANVTNARYGSFRLAAI